MSLVPARRESDHEVLPTRLELSTKAGGGEPTIGELFGILRRNWYIIVGCIALCTGVAYWLTARTTPTYRSSTSIRIGEKQAAIPELLLPLSNGSEVPTEMEVLESRTLAEDAVGQLGLQLMLIEPRRISRTRLLAGMEVARDAKPGVYELTRGADGRFTASREKDGSKVSKFGIGQRVRFNGLAFELRPEAAEHDNIRIAVRAFADAVGSVTANIGVSRSSRDAKIVSVGYQSSDPELAAAVPNVIAQRFVARRGLAQRSVAGSTIEFLRQQLDTLATQLRTAEAALLAYRESERVVNPAVEGSTQVTRLVQLQTERSTLEAERSALGKLLADVEAAAARQGPEEPSPYRHLVSFPTLLRNQAASRLLDALVTVEGERTELLARRTKEDPDVQTMTTRIKGIETELRGMAVTYLRGLGHQVSGLDSTLGGFGRQLEQVPARELQYGRLVRQPQLLEELYALLQTRLKEAEIAQAASDLSIQVVDPAIEPRRPFRPRSALNLMLGMMLGTVLGTATGFLRELLDKTVHTRADVMVATGLSVIGLIPRIPRKGRFALISEKSARRPAPVKPAEPAKVYTPPPTSTVRYTFLGADESANGVGAEEPGAQAGPSGMPTALPPAHAGVRHMAVSDAGAAALEAYGGLLTNMSYSLADAPPRVVAFTSALPGEGKTTNTVNLAIALAHRGMKVLLVDCDLRRGLVHNVFEASREPGLTNVLWGHFGFEQARRTVELGDHAKLDYLTTGTLPPNPTSLVESATMRELLQRWREEYDNVIIDTPPVNVITDAALLGAHADGVVLIARAGMTHGAALGYALDQLRRVQAQVLGVVLSDIDFARDIAYDPTYRYHRYDQYTTAEG
jgi:tyrosine-protein kinase Etk/Wzc